jgi:creatinine amidohydrolase
VERSQRALGALDSRHFERVIPDGGLVILPVGAMEAHGPHLPLATDQLQAEATAQELAERIHGWVAPTLPYGVCIGARRFPGSLSLTTETLARLIEEVVTGLARQGVRRIVVLSGHAEAVHMAALRTGADRAVSRSAGLRVLVLSDYDFAYERRGTDAPANDGHGGLIETSRMLHLQPSVVGAERPIGRRGGSPFIAGPPTLEEWPESVHGDTTTASPELGAKLQSYIVDRLAETVEKFLPA